MGEELAGAAPSPARVTLCAISFSSSRQRCGLRNVMHLYPKLRKLRLEFFWTTNALCETPNPDSCPIPLPHLLCALVHMLSRVEAERGGRPLQHSQCRMMLRSVPAPLYRRRTNGLGQRTVGLGRLSLEVSRSFIPFRSRASFV